MHAAQRTRLHHAFVLLLLSLQLGVVGVVPVADGYRELVALSRVTHVESEGRTDCPPPHNHVTCQLCRVAGPKFASPAVLSLSLGAYLAVCPAPEWSRSVRGARLTHPAPARAPPLA